MTTQPVGSGCRSNTMSSHRRADIHVAPKDSEQIAPTWTFERDDSPKGQEDEREKNGRGHLAHATAVTGNSCLHTTHYKSHAAPLALGFASPFGGFKCFIYTGK